MFLAPGMLIQADTDHDSKVSRQEFALLAEKWFTAWDTNRSGKLDEAKIRVGMNTSLGPPPNMRFPGGGPNRGFSLQGPEGGRNGVAAMAGIEFKYVPADLEMEDLKFQKVAVRWKGNGTFMEARSGLKRSLKIQLNKYVEGQKLGDVTTLNLQCNVTDASFMNEVLAYRLYRDAGVPGPRTSYARVFLTVPGLHEREYIGLYSVVENQDKTFFAKEYGTRRGAIFKPVTGQLFEDQGDRWAGYRQTYDPKTHIYDEQSDRIMQLCRLVTHASDAEFNEKISEFIDLDNFARYMAVMVFLSDMDGLFGPGQNFYMYLHPKSQLLTFHPWDQDHSFGQFPMRGTQPEREDLSIMKPWEAEKRFLERMFKLDSFKKIYLAHLTEFTATLFRPERFRQQVDDLAAVLRGAVKEESPQKLERFEAVVAGKEVPPSFGGFGGGPPRGGGPGDRTFGPGPGGQRGGGMRFGGMPGFFQPNKPIKPFVQVRYQSIKDQLEGKSQGKEIGSTGGRGGFGGFGGGPRGGPGGPGGFGPGTFLAGTFLTTLDADKDGAVTKAEFTSGLAKFFEAWDTDKAGQLDEAQLRTGINKDFSPFGRGGPPGFPRPPENAEPPDSPDP